MFTVLLYYQESVDSFYHLASTTNEPLLDDVEHKIINHQNQVLGYLDADKAHTRLDNSNIMQKPNSVIVVFFSFYILKLLYFILNNLQKKTPRNLQKFETTAWTRGLETWQTLNST